MRGTLQCRVASEGESGIIPAYAGNTFSATPTPTSTGDHPRVCGEHPKAVPLTEASAGSSPRMRGTPERHHVAPRQGGIIPAYAGNTRRSSNAPSPTRDHPRVCGEHTPLVECPVTDQGSSPRMRGTPRIGVESAASPGIIPAYAGNTGVIDLTGQRFEDHPRVCGEHSHELEHVVALQGSSPRMRGTPVLLCVCSFVGSSPRMRGTQTIEPVHERVRGIIPAYAGNT